MWAVLKDPLLMWFPVNVLKGQSCSGCIKRTKMRQVVLMKPVCARTGMCGLDFRINWTSSFVFCQLAEKAFTMAGLTTRGNFLRLSIWSVNCSVELFFISLIFYKSFCKKSEFWFFFFFKGYIFTLWYDSLLLLLLYKKRRLWNHVTLSRAKMAAVVFWRVTVTDFSFCFKVENKRTASLLVERRFLFTVTWRPIFIRSEI